MRSLVRHVRRGMAAALAVAGFLFVQAAPAQNLPRNLGSGLRELLELHKSQPGTNLSSLSLYHQLRQSRVMVEIYANAGSAVPDIEKLLASMSASIAARNLRYRMAAARRCRSPLLSTA